MPGISHSSLFLRYSISHPCLKITNPCGPATVSAMVFPSRPRLGHPSFSFKGVDDGTPLQGILQEWRWIFHDHDAVLYQQGPRCFIVRFRHTLKIPSGEEPFRFSKGCFESHPKDRTDTDPASGTPHAKGNFLWARIRSHHNLRGMFAV